MKQATRTEMINVLSQCESSLVFMWVSDLSTYLKVDYSNCIRKIAESNVAYFEYDISASGKYIYIQTIK